LNIATIDRPKRMVCGIVVHGLPFAHRKGGNSISNVVKEHDKVSKVDGSVPIVIKAFDGLVQTDPFHIPEIQDDISEIDTPIPV
jgi:hypothetical protein